MIFEKNFEKIQSHWFGEKFNLSPELLYRGNPLTWQNLDPVIC